jgi:hypothetical protein
MAKPIVAPPIIRATLEPFMIWIEREKEGSVDGNLERSQRKCGSRKRK